MLANGVTEVAMGINIFSGSKECNGLGAALTNPTALARRKGTLQSGYDVTIGGRSFADAESAYQTLKRESETLDFAGLQRLMVRVLIAKLKQHPRLVGAIEKRGGVAWLESCRHIVNGGHWEGVGVESAFLRCLIDAFRHVTSAWAEPTGPCRITLRQRPRRPTTGQRDDRCVDAIPIGCKLWSPIIWGPFTV